MNYKIRITAENQAIVKRIADENGMNPNDFHINIMQFYYIKDGILPNITINDNYLDFKELTTEQFIEMFDKKETEWQPKRGDKVLVWDDNNYCERIFLAEIKKSEYPIVTVHHHYEIDFLNDDVFSVVCFKYMKPLQAEQPIETDFKTKVIELVEKRIAICIESIEEYKKLNSFSACEIWRNCKHENQLLLKQIKEL
jgi:hypothetical protein